ncbi:adenylate/guanylate cyclase domain-containing protein [Mycolicibacterium arseniciresistens]|uniref:Adenylate/guanylate cyclase domain-containing protein n=1 Tax=Mycolicibacterium arseniciresistens TaxID=3062257 RepID=A0ABT8UC63_9MYCO|nr:adenylate/guanylate cyclase domain-containing protein [Mycolicibacterium arseniciresistens]MDO3635357.1 adenylate/guanylate cyclase domain-containing protein [Mycolicibacterium arseniciresistens]
MAADDMGEPAWTPFEHADTHAVVIFADLSGFTALTEVHGDHHAAELADAFAGMAADALGPGDEVIKSIGDAVMVITGSAEAALGFLTRLTEATRRAGGFPLLSAGVSSGPVIRRRGDVFGATVNLAARLAGQASAGQILIDPSVAAAGAGSGLPIAALGAMRLRNIAEPIEVYAVDVASTHQGHVDPVCRMHIAATGTAVTVTHDHRVYRFCSSLCATRFSRRPEDFATSESPVFGRAQS